MNNPPEWTSTAAAWLNGEDATNYPPDWVLEMAYEQASSGITVGNTDAALSLLQMLQACLLEKGEFRLSPKAREILASMLTAILDGTDPAKAMFLESKSGHPHWINLKRNNGIVTVMSIYIDDGMKTAVAARQVAASKLYKDSKSGKPLTAKTITNIWLNYKKNPQPRITFSRPKVPE